MNQRLEAVKAELRVREEVLRAELRAREVEIQALQSGALAAMASRRAAIDKRRLEAIDDLWRAVVAVRPGIALARALAPLNFEVALRAAADNPSLREAFGAMASAFDPSKVDLTTADRARPHVSPMAWALYVALSSIALQAAAKATILRVGAGEGLLLTGGVKPLVALAMPDRAAALEGVADAQLFEFVEELEGRILRELWSSLESDQADHETLQRAAAIVRTAAALQTKGGAGPTTPMMR